MLLPPVAKVSDLRRRGVSRRELDALIASGSYRRLGNGWLAAERGDAQVVLALGAGARLTCVSAAKVHGLWTPPVPGVHVYRRAGAGPGRGLDGGVEHWPPVRRWPDQSPVAPLPLALEHAARCLDVVEAAILLESAWNRGLVDASGVGSVLARVPHRVSRSLARVRRSAESGTETKVRWWLESQRVGVRAQVRIPGVGRVDLLVGERWVIECDSVAHHTGLATYADDRRRDLELRRRGYLVTRLTWEQVFLSWASTQQALLEILRQQEHRQKLSSCSRQFDNEPLGSWDAGSDELAR